MVISFWVVHKYMYSDFLLFANPPYIRLYSRLYDTRNEATARTHLVPVDDTETATSSSGTKHLNTRHQLPAPCTLGACPCPVSVSRLPPRGTARRTR